MDYDGFKIKLEAKLTLARENNNEEEVLRLLESLKRLQDIMDTYK